jgi:hypothetical protein
LVTADSTITVPDCTRPVAISLAVFYKKGRQVFFSLTRAVRLQQGGSGNIIERCPRCKRENKIFVRKEGNSIVSSGPICLFAPLSPPFPLWSLGFETQDSSLWAQGPCISLRNCSCSTFGPMSSVSKMDQEFLETFTLY